MVLVVRVRKLVVAKLAARSPPSRTISWSSEPNFFSEGIRATMSCQSPRYVESSKLLKLGTTRHHPWLKHVVTNT